MNEFIMMKFQQSFKWDVFGKSDYWPSIEIHEQWTDNSEDLKDYVLNRLMTSLPIWNDDDQWKRFSKTLYKYPSPIEMKMTCVKFLDFYINGDINCQNFNIIFCAILIAPTVSGEGFLFSEMMDEKNYDLSSSIWPKNDGTELLFSIKATTGSQASTEEWNSTIFERWANNQIQESILGETFVHLRKLVSHLALLSVRFKCRSPLCVKEALYNTGIYRDVWKGPISNIALPPVHPNYLKCCGETNDIKGNIRMDILVHRYILARKRRERGVVRLLYQTCMQDLSMYGLKLIELILKCMTLFRWTFEDFITNMPSGIIKIRLEALKLFFEAHINSPTIQYGYKWARLVDHIFFQNLSISNNIDLCIHVAALLEHRNSDVFELKTLKKAHPRKIKYARGWAICRLKYMKSMGDYDWDI